MIPIITWLEKNFLSLAVQDGGTSETQRSAINFVGLKVTDNPDNDSTDVSLEDITISGNVTHVGTHGSELSVSSEFLSVGAITDDILVIAIPDECVMRVDYTIAMKAVGVVARGGSADGKVTVMRSGGGAASIIGSAEYGTPQFTVGGDGAAFALVGNDLKIRVTSADSANRNWRSETRIAKVLAT